MVKKAPTTHRIAVLAAQVLDDNKALDIQILDVRKLTSVTDFMIIATGRSSRHVKALADHVAVAVRTAGHDLLGIEGESAAEWILIDLGDAIVHVMQAQTRAFYQLEKLWAPLPARKAAAE